MSFEVSTYPIFLLAKRVSRDACHVENVMESQMGLCPEVVIDYQNFWDVMRPSMGATPSQATFGIVMASRTMLIRNMDASWLLDSWRERTHRHNVIRSCQVVFYFIGALNFISIMALQTFKDRGGKALAI